MHDHLSAHSFRPRPAVLAAALITVQLVARSVPAQDIDVEPILYSSAPVHDPVARLDERLARGDARLEHDEKHGYLRSVLRALDILECSQCLVFSKTSFQRDFITPETPRAVYFNDAVSIGWVQGGKVLEVAALDPKQGSIFYTLEQRSAEKPRFERRNAECLQCHASPLTKGVPGVLVRSVRPDPSGMPILRLGTHTIDHTSPLAQRWGGWYVTGTHGPETHLGNAVFRDDPAAPQLPGPTGLNVRSLRDRLDPSPYLEPGSDIVALMVLEHQMQGHNLLTAAGYQARTALHHEAAMSTLLGTDPERPSESTLRRFGFASTPLLKYLLFVDESELKAPVLGTSEFAATFEQRGPRDGRGRSLRDLDLTRRLFRHRLSYLVYSAAFDELPASFRAHLLERLWGILCGKDTSPDFARVSAAERRTALEILLATKPGLPASWRQATDGARGG